MNPQAVHTLMTTVELVNANLDTAPDSWRDQLQAIRNTTAVFEITDTTPDEARRRWQMPFICVVQRVAFADADNGPITDIADWCLRQLLTLLQVYPNDVEILTLIGRNWLLRAQKALASIARAENGPFSIDASHPNQSQSVTRPLIENQERLNGAHYVEARGLLLPATDYLERAVGAAKAQGSMSGSLLSVAAEAFMSLGNVTSPRIHDCYFRRAMAHLRAATELDGYSLPVHLQQYFDEYGFLYDDA